MMLNMKLYNGGLFVEIFFLIEGENVSSFCQDRMAYITTS